jgi:tripeptide aminopeptidase
MMSDSRLYRAFKEFTSIDSPSFGERGLCDLLGQKLSELDIPYSEDDAAGKLGGTSGNLYAFAQGELSMPPLLFSAHMDTVEPSESKKAILHDDGKITSDGTSVLGADDVSGIVIILEALTRLKESGTAHRPVELLFPVAEERYGLGSALYDYGKIKSREAYVLDLGGEMGSAASAAPTIISFAITVKGKAAHAGFAPKEGVHAIAVVAAAISRITMGEATPGVRHNIGTISGGKASNIVPDHCSVAGEIRSLDHAAALADWETIKSVFEQEAYKNGAKAEFSHRVEISAYRTPPDSRVVKRFERACEAVGLTANIMATYGGSDQNNFALHGIEGIVPACSMHDVHSTGEYAWLHELEQGVLLVMKLMTLE